MRRFATRLYFGAAGLFFAVMFYERFLDELEVRLSRALSWRFSKLEWLASATDAEKLEARENGAPLGSPPPGARVSAKP